MDMVRGFMAHARRGHGSDEAWRQIQWGEPLFRETYFVV